MPNDIIQMNMHTWTTSSGITTTEKSKTDDLVSDLFKTLNDFFTDMAPVYFLSGMTNLQTAIEEFGQGMNAALACVSVDLQVVSSGLASAVSAFGATDKALADTFAHLDAQLGYYTDTHVAANTMLPTPTAANVAALDTAYQQYYSVNASGSTGIHISKEQAQNSEKAAGITVIGIVTILVIIGLSPIGA